MGISSNRASALSHYLGFGSRFTKAFTKLTNLFQMVMTFTNYEFNWDNKTTPATTNLYESQHKTWSTNQLDSGTWYYRIHKDIYISDARYEIKLSIDF